jgi:cell division septation protein DedD
MLTAIAIDHFDHTWEEVMTVASQRIHGSAASIALAVVCLVLLSAGCSKHAEQKVADAKGKVADAKEKVGEATEDLQSAQRDERSEWKQSWLSFKNDFDKDLTDNEAGIAARRAEVEKIDAGNRSRYNASLDDAERKNNELRDRVNNYKDEGDAKWELFKTDTRRELDDLKATIKDISIKNG